MKHLSNDQEDSPNQQKNSHKLGDEMGHLVLSFNGKSMETETTRWSTFSNGGKATVEQILASEEKRQIQKSRTVRVTVRSRSRKVNHLSKVIWDRKIIAEFTRSISSTRIGKPVLMMDIKVSKGKHISRWVDQENLIYVGWNRVKTCA